MRTRSALFSLSLLVFSLFLGLEPAHSGQCEDLFQPRLRVLNDIQYSKAMAYSQRNFERQPVTVGVEIEGLIPGDLTYRDLAQVMINHVQTEFPDHRLQINELATKSAYFGSVVLNWGPWYRTRTMVLKPDGTLPMSGERYGVEIASPVLQTPRDFQIFVSMINHLIEQGIYKPYSKAGVHVHIGFPEADPREVALLARLFSAVQDDAYEHFNVWPSREPYAGKLPEGYAGLLSRLSQKTRSLGRFWNHFLHKYNGLNLLHLTNESLRTVEFRFFNSIEDVSELKAAIAFSAVLVEQVRKKGPLIESLLRGGKTNSEIFEEALQLSEDFLQEKFNDPEPGVSRVDTPTLHPAPHRTSVRLTPPETETPAFFRTG